MDNISVLLIGIGQRVEYLILHILKIDKRVFFQKISTSVEPFEYAFRPTTLYLWGVCVIRPKNKNTYIA